VTEFQIPMDDVPNEFTKLDESKLYVCRIAGVEIKKTGPMSKTPGEPMIAVQLEVRQPQEWEGKIMFDNLLLPLAPTPLDSTAERRKKLERGVRLRQFMEAAELKWSPSGFSTEDWVGAEVGCTIRNEEGLNGDTFARPKKLMLASVAKDAIKKTESGSPGDNGPIPGVTTAQDGGI
jgi:hypothetical protein